MSDFIDAFASLKDPEDTYTDPFYPGSKKKRVNFKKERQEKIARKRSEEPWDHRSIKGSFRGVNTEFFMIGALAKAINKKPVTIRKWISNKWLPDAHFRSKPIKGTRGDAGRRLWTRNQILLIQKIAEEEGIIGTWHPDIEASNFTQRIREAWRGTYQ